jgi:hypothetical protein
MRPTQCVNVLITFDPVPAAEFNTTHLNTALAAIGLPSTPVLSLAFGRNL